MPKRIAKYLESN